MFAITLSSGISFYLYITFGFLITKVAKMPANLAEKALIGLVAANTLTTIISVFYPINILTLMAILLCSLFPLYIVRYDFKQLFLIFVAKKNIVYWSFPFILITYIASLGLPRSYDSGLYHIQAIKWIEEYAVVPGLANLHGRFGFNPNIFTFYAATALTDIFKQEVFSVNLTVYVILVLHFLNRIHYIFKRDGITNILIFNLIIFLNILFTLYNISSPNPDFITAVLPFYIFASTAAFLGGETETGIQNYLPIAILCVYVLTVKLATIPLILLLLFIVLKHSAERKANAWLVLGSIVILLPWLVRNIILSGWLIYPFPSLDLFNLDWKVPLHNVISDKMSITGWAINPGKQYLAAAQMNISEWFPIWWHRISIGDKMLFTIAIIAPLVGMISARINKVKIDYYTCAVTATSFFGVIFWLMLAPNIRFGKPFLVIATISPLLFWKFQLLKDRKGTGKLIKALYLLVILLLSLNAKNIIRFDYRQVAYKPQTIDIPQEVDFRSYNLRGVKIFVPTSGDRCYDHVIPCTPYPDSALMLRGQTLQAGFSKH